MPRLTVKEAAAYIPLAEGTLNKFRSVGGGPRYVKLGRKILYDTADLDRWIDSHKQKSTADTPANRPRRSPGRAA
jgi:predicted DNA-binding transcriptional regulator AlpA